MMKHAAEPKSDGHVTITHRMSASTFRVFLRLNLSRFDKNAGKLSATLFQLILKTCDILFLIYLGRK